MTGVPIGLEPGPNLAGDAGRHETPRAAFEDELRKALRRPPCLISFSGGRDSSALLTLAAHVASREGLPQPVPATLVFPGEDAADESQFQLEALERLALDKWIKIEVRDELDVVGPVAGPLLRRHGLLWPFNTHMHAPIVAAAAGGSVVTGFGGDEMGNAAATARAAWVIARQRRPVASDALVLGLALSPKVVRQAVELRRDRRSVSSMPWLTPHAQREVGRQRSAHNTSVPIRFDRRVAWWHATRYRQICVDSFDILGGDFDVEVHHPFAAPSVGSALAQEGGFGGYGSRTAMLQHIFGDIMSESIVRRESKASFSNPLFARHSAGFASTWDGSGLDPRWVDIPALQRHWRAGDPDVRTLPLLQEAWLSQDPTVLG